jgi:hypothetical protein
VQKKRPFEALLFEEEDQNMSKYHSTRFAEQLETLAASLLEKAAKLRTMRLTKGDESLRDIWSDFADLYYEARLFEGYWAAFECEQKEDEQP